MRVLGVILIHRVHVEYKHLGQVYILITHAYDRKVPVDKGECPQSTRKYYAKRLPRNLPWVECDNCTQWFHTKCVGLTKKTADELPKWFCVECKF